jgi:GDPmannose 4,6-dehydratase
MTFAEVGADIEFKGEGVDETGVVVSCTNEYGFQNGQEVVKIDPRYFRPTEVELLIGDATKAKEKLGWQPKYSLKQMVSEMVETDLDEFKREQLLIKSGFDVARQYE